MQNHIVVDVIETGFLADWMPVRKMEGREARCLATAKKSMFPVWISLKRERIMVHIEQAEPLKQLIPNTAVSGALPFLEREN